MESNYSIPIFLKPYFSVCLIFHRKTWKILLDFQGRIEPPPYSLQNFDKCRKNTVSRFCLIFKKPTFLNKLRICEVLPQFLILLPRPGFLFPRPYHFFSSMSCFRRNLMPPEQVWGAEYLIREPLHEKQHISKWINKCSMLRIFLNAGIGYTKFVLSMGFAS